MARLRRLACGAKLDRANLHMATLCQTDLRGADLRGARLTQATLIDVQLEGAEYDAKTRWPDGFDPSA